MNEQSNCRIRLAGPGHSDTQRPDATSALQAGGGEGPPIHRVIRPVSGLQARNKIDAAIDEWAEALVAIIEASDNPEASLQQAHLAIASKHREVESVLWRELQIRGQDAGAHNG